MSALPDPARRRLLQASGWTAAGLTVLFSSGCALPVLPSIRGQADDDADAWLQALPDNRIRFFIGKAEMGQGIVTGLTQIIAQELDVPIERIEWTLGHTGQVPRLRMTVGSESVQTLYAPLRDAARRLAAGLRRTAADRLQVAESELAMRGGGFVISSTGGWLGYGDALAGKPPQVGAPNPPGKSIGTSVPRLDIPDKVAGRAIYAHDVRLPGMRYGKVARPPALGARLKRVSADVARRLPGVIAVVEAPEDEFVGVVAESESAAANAVRSLELEWELPRAWEQAEIEAMLDPAQLERDGRRAHRVLADGDLRQGRAAAIRQIDLAFATPFAAHAAMETHAGVASVRADGAELWVSSQDAPFHRDLAAQLTGLSARDVVVHPTLVGGGFGGKVYVAAALEAVRLSAAVRQPVRVIWTREETFRHGYLRSATRHRIRAGIARDGRVSFWQHEFASGPVIYSPALLARPVRWLTSFMADDGIARGARLPYAIPHRQVRFWQPALPVATGPWRGLGASLNCFAIESAIDELAHLAEIDPVAFRLRHLDGGPTRLRRVIEAAAARAGWGTPMASGVGRGIACGVYKDTSFVAVVAEVALEPASREIAVSRLVCAHDCGLLINPDAVRAQIEGNLVWGCSSALKEELVIRNGRIDAANFDAYPILRLHETPAIDIVLLEDPGVPPGGAGEPALMPVAAAIANAVRAAAGRRLTRLPIRPDDIFS